MAFSRFYLTNNGLSYLAKAHAGKRLAVTRAQFGDGAKPAEAAPVDMTALVHPLGDMPISDRSARGNTATITTQFSNQTTSGGVLPAFHLMEAGLFARILNEDGSADAMDPEILLAYAYASNREEADYIQAVLTEFIMNWPLSHSNAASIVAVIDSSLVYPTREEFYAGVGIDATAGGTGAAITIPNPDGVELTDGTRATIKLTADLLANATVSVDGGTPYPIYTSDGKPVEDGLATAGSYLPLSFNDAEKRWYITGGGGGMKKEDKEKLDGIEAGANKYIHPDTHPVSMITGLGNAATKNVGTAAGTVAEGNHNHDAVYAAKAHKHTPADVNQDANNRFVSDAEKATWNAKQAALTFDTTPTANSANPVTSGGIKTALDGKAAASHTHTKAQVGLGNVDNTSDANKPISTATQTALNGKAPTAHASAATTYGIGTSANYGHVKLSAATNSTSGAGSGIAASPSAVKAAYDLAASKAAASHKHAPADINQDAANRFVSDAEKATWNAKQNTLTFDTTPTANSTKPVTSGGIKTALDGKVSTTRKVNQKALSTDITLSAADVGAVPTTGGTMTGALAIGGMRLSWDATAKALNFEVVT